MFGLRLPELLIILVVLVLLFGAKKLPDLGDALGKSLRAFKKASDHGFRDDDEGAEAKPQRELPNASATTAAPVADRDKASAPASPPASDAGPERRGS